MESHSLQWIYNGKHILKQGYTQQLDAFFGGKSYEIDCFFQYQNGQWIDTRFSQENRWMVYNVWYNGWYIIVGL